MHHASHFILMYGCTHRGDSDMNESMHRGTKMCYASTNKRNETVAKQIVKLRSICAHLRGLRSADLYEIILNCKNTDLRHDESDTEISNPNQLM